MRLPNAAKFGRSPAPNSTANFETVAVVVICGFAIYFMTRSAFDTFFIAEDFFSTRLLLAAEGDFLKAVFSPLAWFFRPSSFAWSAIANEVLRPKPLIHHWISFSLDLLCVLLLHRILLRLAESRTARLVGIAFFTISKVHLTLIGLINGIELIGVVLCSLTAYLFLIRFVQNETVFDYFVAICSFTLVVFSRDIDVLFFLVVLATFILNAWQLRCGVIQTIPRLAVRILPFLLIAIIYVMVRNHILSEVALPSKGDNYSVHLDIKHLLAGVYYCIGNLANLPLNASHLSGSGDFSTLMGFAPAGTAIYRILLIGILSCSLIVVLVSAVRTDLGVLSPLLWASVMFFPTLLVGNQHIYYLTEPVVALSIVLAMAIDRSEIRRGMTSVWGTLLIVVGLNGWASSKNVDVYWWRAAANEERRLYEQIYEPNRGLPFKSLKLVVDTPAAAKFYEWLVDPFGYKFPNHPALLQELMSPSIKSFEAIPFDRFSFKGVDQGSGPGLIYRMDLNQNGLTNFTDITNRSIEIVSIEADNVAEPSSRVDKLVDRRTVRDGAGLWISENVPGPHSIVLKFSDSVLLGSVRIANYADFRIAELEIEVFTDGVWKVVFDNAGLQNAEIINARWRDEESSAIRISIKSSLLAGAPSSVTAIGSLDFPENRFGRSH
jgi:hypothetical protein